MSWQPDSPIQSRRPLSGGDIGEVEEIQLADGRRLVRKRSRPSAPATAEVEAMMLRHLAGRGVPVPGVVAASAEDLVLEAMPSGGRMTAEAAQTLARHIADMHDCTALDYGFDRPTVFAGDPQDNRPAADWPRFWCERRLKPMLQAAEAKGLMPAKETARVKALADAVSDLLPAEPPASLLHGDLWLGNVLVGQRGQVALIDPAIYYGHAEVDLAMLTLFGSPGRAFFDAYRQRRPLDPAFFRYRAALYNLYPMLFHLKAFGPGYLAPLQGLLIQVERA